MRKSILALAVLIAVNSEAQAQSNYTYNASEQVLVDNATGLKWQCGYGLAWSYSTYFPAGYDYAKDVVPGVYTQGPYGAPGGWRMPSTAELLDASSKGLHNDLFQVAVTLGLADPQHDDSSWWPFWGIDPKTTKHDAFYVVLGTGQKVKTLRASSYLYVLLVR
jgi:hypothetical protein